MPLAGGPIEQITHDSVPSFYPSLSPDGSEVAYHTVARDGRRRVYVRPADGGAAIPISPGTDADERAAIWAAVGTRIAWSTPRRPDHFLSWFTERGPDGRFGPARHLGGPGFSIIGWSPDARYVIEIGRASCRERV